ncbi:UNVERIFIED_CONTAM: hypothetical protein FKN15_012799 [Acipenser sinensis]
MNTRCPLKHVPLAARFFTLCSRLRATASEDNAALGSLQASPQAPSQTTGVAGARWLHMYPHGPLRTTFPIILLLTGKSISVTYVSRRMMGNVVLRGPCGYM